jgi:hypothetical protein
MELDWYCTDIIEMRHQCWYRLLWIFKRLLASPLGRQRSPHQSVWFLILNIQANRVAIVSSVITKIFNPSKYRTVTIQLRLNKTSWSVLSMFIASFYRSTFVCLSVFLDSVLYSMLLFDSVLLFSIPIIQCIFCPEPENVLQVSQSRYTPTNK